MKRDSVVTTMFKRIITLLTVMIIGISSVGCGSVRGEDASDISEETDADQDTGEDDSDLRLSDKEEPSLNSPKEDAQDESAVREQITETAVWIDELEDGAMLLVCTAPDYIFLQSKPGIEEENGQTRLYPGTYLKWYGEKETVEKKDYILVTNRDTGEKGWIEYLYAVRVGWDPDTSVLNVVETEDPLYTYDMMVRDIDVLCNMYQNALHKNIVGKSVTGKDLYEVILGDPDASHHVMIQATIHAREYVNTQLMMKLLEYYAHYYDTGVYGNARYADLFDNVAFHVVPMVNPDGVTISQSGVDALNDPAISQMVREAYERDKETLVYEMNSNGDMTWIDHYRDEDFDREADPDASRVITFDEYQSIWKANGNGVDLNNNFDAAWEDIDLKWEPSYGSFKGYAAVSEPEAKALADMAVSRDFECYLSYHSTGQLIYYDCEGNSEAMSETENEFAEFMQDKIHHRMSNNKSAYNVNLGGFGDWIQLSLNKPSLTIESGKKPCPLPKEEFTAIWLRHRESWAALAQMYN